MFFNLCTYVFLFVLNGCYFILKVNEVLLLIKNKVCIFLQKHTS